MVVASQFGTANVLSRAKHPKNFTLKCSLSHLVVGEFMFRMWNVVVCCLIQGMDYCCGEIIVGDLMIRISNHFTDDCKVWI